MDVEAAVNWGEDPHGRRAQIERELQKTEDYTQSLVHEFTQKKETIVALQTDNKRHIEETAQNAYKALEDEVSILLAVESGTRRLSRENAAIVTALSASVEHFGSLSEVSRKNTSNLGITAAQCMSLGDGAASFIAKLTSRIESFNADYRPMRERSNGYGNDYWNYRNRENELRSQLGNAESERDLSGNGLNRIASWFDNGVEDRLRRNVDDARNRLNANQAEQNQAKDRMETLYQLSIFTRNASSVLTLLKERIRTISDGFDDEFKGVITAQDVESELWKGLKQLKNNIWSPEFTSTRDNSLRLILQLLTADDEVFLRQEYYEKTEERIKVAIRAKIGEDAVERLTVPVPDRVSLEDFQLHLLNCS